MKGRGVLLALLTTLGMITGCGDGAPNKPAAAAAPAPQPSLPAQHYYVLEDDGAYGYERAPSEEDIRQGRKATDVIMVRYVGQQDGKWQVALNENDVFTIFECVHPCEFVKAMVFDGESPAIKVERMRVQPGVLAYHMMADAINGKLTHRMGLQKNGKAYSVWFDEKKGPILTLADKK